MAYYDFASEPPKKARASLFAGPANDHNIAYSTGTEYQYMSGSLVPSYASGNGSTTLTFTKACTLNIFISAGRVRNSGTSNIVAVKNGSPILTISNPYEPYYAAGAVCVDMAVGDTLRIYATGTNEGYAIHSFCITILDTV